jgi:pilus assembly protein FimV
MLAIQRLNPEAFGGNNINSLHRGAILRMPSLGEVGRLTQRQAMVEAIRQEQAFRARRAGLAFADEPPMLAEAAIADASPEHFIAPAAPATASAEEARLELVPPSSGEPSGGGGDIGEDAQSTGAVSGSDLEEVLARTEEELVNAQQENAYLNERIRELERQIADASTSGAVVDQDLAALESGLREKRAKAADAVEPAAAKEAQAWYQGKTLWLVVALMAVIGLGVWILRRMATPATGAVGGIRGEAEDMLRVLGTDDRGPQQPGSAGFPGASSGRDQAVDTGADKRRAKPTDDGEAIELDTSDPETQLDLARAYLSMGDPEAAREMLEAVLAQGNEAQVAEARGMMKEL